MEFAESKDDEHSQQGTVVVGPEIARSIGVTFDDNRELFKAEYKWGGGIRFVGYFSTQNEAILARDFEVLAHYFDASNEHLNRRYTLKTLNSKGKDIVYEVTGADGQSFQLCKGQEIDSNVTSALEKTKEDFIWRAKQLETITPFIQNPNLPGKVDINKKWSDRVTSLYTPSATFAYEISFNHQNPLGLNLRPHVFHYPSSTGRKSIGCCVVIDASPMLSPVVSQGDILLRVNDVSLLSSSSDGFNFEATTRIITSAQAPKTIRFLRLAGNSYNVLPCPAELQLLSQDNVQIVAKFSVGTTNTSSGASNIVSVTTSSSPSLQLTQIDGQAPLALRKMMQVQRVTWESSAGSAPVMNPFGQYGVKVDSIGGNKISSGSAGSSGVISSGPGSGVFRERQKWVVLTHMTGKPGNQTGGKLTMVGRFDTEDEANFAYKRAVEEIRTTGTFAVKRLRKILDTPSGPTIPTTSVIPSSYNAYYIQQNRLATAVPSSGTTVPVTTTIIPNTATPQYLQQSACKPSYPSYQTYSNPQARYPQ